MLGKFQSVPGICWVVAAVILSAMGSLACFPPFQSSEAAWCCLVPLLLCLRPGASSRPFWIGYSFGFIFWVGTLYWLRHVTWFGWFLLSAYCALYPGIFCAILHRIWNRIGDGRRRDRLLLMFLAATLWGGLEWIRYTFASGFPWNGFGVSQYERISLIQITSIGGVYLLSSLLVLFNMALVFVVLRYVQRGCKGRGILQSELLTAFALVSLVSFYGLQQVTETEASTQSARLALIQPNIPQTEKWTREFEREIYRRLIYWTELVQTSQPELDLIVWPETALPDNVLHSEASMNLVIHLTSGNIPLLVGSMDMAWPEQGPIEYFNSSFLFGKQGELRSRYDKQHLVLMGEYIPFHRYLGFLDPISPIAVSFTSGKSAGRMDLGGSRIPFSPLICFEDTVPDLSRRAVREGSRLLVNQTNDAWFDPSAGSRQHFINAIFRSVENRVPLVRCCNTGVTAFVDRFGRLQRLLETPEGDLQFEGYLTGNIPVPGDEFTMTPYTRLGDWFGVGGGVLAIGLGLWTWREQKRDRISFSNE